MIPLLRMWFWRLVPHQCRWFCFYSDNSQGICCMQCGRTHNID